MAKLVASPASAASPAAMFDVPCDFGDDLVCFLETTHAPSGLRLEAAAATPPTRGATSSETGKCEGRPSLGGTSTRADSACSSPATAGSASSSLATAGSASSSPAQTSRTPAGTQDSCVTPKKANFLARSSSVASLVSNPASQAETPSRDDVETAKQEIAKAQAAMKDQAKKGKADKSQSKDADEQKARGKGKFCSSCSVVIWGEVLFKLFGCCTGTCYAVRYTQGLYQL